MKTIQIKLLVVLVGIMLAARPCQAINIVYNFVSTGSTIPGQGIAVDPDPNKYLPFAGAFVPFFVASQLAEVSHDWGTIFSQSRTLTIDWGFMDLSGGAAASTGGPATIVDGNGRITRTSMVIARSPATTYMDRDVTTWGEYPGGSISTLRWRDFVAAGKHVEIGRYTATETGSPDTRNNDLFSTLLHETGHALGMLGTLPRYVSEIADGDIDVTAPRPCAGYTWGVIGGHLNPAGLSGGMDHCLMKPAGVAGLRTWPSMVDVSCIAQAMNWFVNVWSPSDQPEVDPAAGADFPPH